MTKPNGLKPVIPVLAEEQKTNKALIADFQSSKNPDATPASHITVVNSPAIATPLIGSLEARFSDTSVKLQNILQNNKK